MSDNSCVNEGDIRGWRNIKEREGFQKRRSSDGFYIFNDRRGTYFQNGQIIPPNVDTQIRKALDVGLGGEFILKVGEMALELFGESMSRRSQRFLGGEVPQKRLKRGVGR